MTYASFESLRKELIEFNTVPSTLYDKFEVKRGLRNKDGSGVLAGLTRISSVVGFHKVEGEMVPVEGVLKYRGVLLEDIINSASSSDPYFFERTCFLLLVGRVPSDAEFKTLIAYMAEHRSIPQAVIDHVIQAIPSQNIMNKLQTAVSALYAFDADADNIDPLDAFLKSLRLLSQIPTIIAYSYLTAYKPHTPLLTPPKTGSMAESFLTLLNPGQTPHPLHVHIMDICLVLHAEHGGGNNSTFATHVVSSSQSDIYSTMAAAIASLKGPLHGSANKKVMDMMSDIKANVKDWGNIAELTTYLERIIKQEVGDKSGKIYGLGHAVYTLSDPRATEIKKLASELAPQVNRQAEYDLYLTLETLGPQVFNRVKGIDKVITPNVDFFSGFVYDCLGIPEEIYTAIFAMARTCGWCAHFIEENLSGKRIIRPAYKYI